MFFKFWENLTCSHFNPHGKHCYITGGSAGLGKALAILLAKRGAHVTIVGRRVQALKEAQAEIQQSTLSSSQRITILPADVCVNENCIQALNDATEKCGFPPDYVFTCAGASQPGLLLEQDVKQFEDSMRLNYFGTLYTVKHAAKLMVENNVVKGKLIMIGSTLSITGFVGYSQYAASKHALRGLADCLRNELLMNDITVHLALPGTIYTDGYKNEELMKHPLTKKIEGDDGSSPEHIATEIIRGLEKDQFMITSDFLTDCIRCTMTGLSPRNHFWDLILMFFGAIFLSPFRWYCDYLVQNFKKNLK